MMTLLTWKAIRETELGQKNQYSNLGAINLDDLNETFINTPVTSNNISNDTNLKSNFSFSNSISNTTCDTLQLPHFHDKSYDNNNLICDNLNLPCDNSFSFSYVSEVDVIECFLKVKSNAVGKDNVHPKFVKLILPKIIKFNSTLTKSEYQQQDGNLQKLFQFLKLTMSLG